MKILHYSDRGSPDFSKLYNECDVMVTTGDLMLQDFDDFLMYKLKKPAFGVYGNHDSGNYFESVGIKNVHNKVYTLNALKIGGFQGCLRYKQGGIYYTEEQAQEFAATFPYVDILLLHAGGEGLLDDSSDEVHRGSPAIRNYILDKKPKYVFCGHLYSNAFLDLGETKVYRTFKARIIDIL